MVNWKLYVVKYKGKHWNDKLIAKELDVCLVTARRRLRLYEDKEMTLKEVFEAPKGILPVTLCDGTVLTHKELMQQTGWGHRHISQRMWKFRKGRITEEALLLSKWHIKADDEKPISFGINHDRAGFAEMDKKVKLEGWAKQEKMMPLKDTPIFTGREQ